MDIINKVFTYENYMNQQVFQELKTYTDGLSFTQPSFVYHRVKEQDVIDTTVRRSHTVKIYDQSMLDFINDQIISNMQGDLVLKLAGHMAKELDMIGS